MHDAWPFSFSVISMYQRLIASTLSFLTMVLPAQAQEVPGDRGVTTIPSPDSIETVTVTARLREEDARDIPFALTVLDRDALITQRVDNPQSFFRQVPGLSLTSFDDGRFAYFQLRGIGPLSQAIGPDDGSVVTYVDGVPQPVFASEFAYLDLQRIEVLRGPQGTLYGRNSQGGAIHITTAAPTDSLESRVRLEAGESGFLLGEATVAGPITDTLSGRVSLRASAVDGFIDNIAPGGGELGERDVLAARGTLLFQANDDSGPRVSLSANIDDRSSSPYYYVRRGQARDEIEIDPENSVDRVAWGASAKIELPLAFARLTSITSINGFDNEQITDDTDGLIYGPLFGLSPEDFLAPLSFSDWVEEETRFFQEFRLSSLPGAETSWSTGIVYFRSELDVELDNRSSFSPILNGDRDATQVIDSYAAYGEVTTTLLDPRLQATLGARYTRDEKSLEARFAGVGFPGSVDSFAEDSEANFDLFTGRVALRFELSENANLYATVARGAKSGGFPRLTLNAAFGAASPAYAESTSWTYEVGLKTVLWDGRGRLDMTGFYNDVTDEQLFVLDFVSFQFVPVNLDTRSYGVEVEGDLVLGSGWSIAGGLSWTDGEIREADAISGANEGNRIPNVARFSSTLNLNYRGAQAQAAGIQFSPFLTLSHQYAGSRSADVANSFTMDNYHNVDLRGGLSAGSTDVYVFARNLLDDTQEINGVLYGLGVEGSSLARPRIIGLGLTTQF